MSVSSAVLSKTTMLYCLILCFFGYTSANVTYYLNGQPNRHPPRFRGLLSVNELAAAGGYPATNYEVITEDGYSIWLFRLGSNPGPPVLMQHGIAVAGDQWITRGPGRDLAFILLDKGFDVWISNRRGTVFSEYNLRYPKSDHRFWNFRKSAKRLETAAVYHLGAVERDATPDPQTSVLRECSHLMDCASPRGPQSPYIVQIHWPGFHEVGYYDIPAIIDTVLDVRKRDKIFYIGHSLGTTEFFVMGSTRPDYCGKVRAAVLLSPVAYPPPSSEMPPAIRLLQRSFNYIYRNLQATGAYELSPRTEESIANTRELCVNNESTKTICLDVVGAISGEHRTNLNLQEWEFFVPYYGAGDSAMTSYHITQVYITGEFKQIDEGPVGNLRRYGSIRPPRYKLNLITAPVALLWGYNDVLTSEMSVKRIASDLPNLIFSKPVPDPKFNHIDMYLGDNTNEVLNPYIIEVLEKFSQGELPLRKEHEFDIRKEPHLKVKEELDSYIAGKPHSYNEGEPSHAKVKGVSHLHTEESSKGDAHSDDELYPDDTEKPCPCNEEEQNSSTKQESQSDIRKTRHG